MSALSCSRERGFTLIELMVTISIAAVLLLIAAPSFGTYQASQAVRSSAEGLTVAFNLARSEAIKSNSSVTVTPGATWAAGWIVARGGVTVRNDGVRNGVTITPSVAGALTFGRDGRLTGGITQASYTIAPNNGASVRSRCVKIELSGKATNRVGDCAP